MKKKHNICTFEYPVKQNPLDRREVLETGADKPVSASVPQPLYKGVTDGNWNIANVYYDYLPSISRDWNSEYCAEPTVNPRSVEVYYRSEIQKMLNSKNRI